MISFFYYHFNTPVLLYLSSFYLLTHGTLVDEPAWWTSLHAFGSYNYKVNRDLRPSCMALEGLSPGQARICELFKDHMPAVNQGATLAMEECTHQFKNDRWNCSAPPTNYTTPSINKAGTREAAFTHAILAAAVTYEIGRKCRLGYIESCGCANTPKPNGLKEDWSWSGCGDNIDYGYRFSKDFIDVREKEHSMANNEAKGVSLMNRWNNDVGRKILKRHTKPKCKCHGVSGSCNLKTCWMQMPSIRQIGNILQSKYRSARRIQINSRGNMQIVAHVEKRGIEKSKKTRSQLQTELVFLQNSPDYCRSDNKTGTIGTEGRICNKDSQGPDSCDLLCCGRGYNSYIEEVETKCNCKFQWCCKVVCDICKDQTYIHTCK
uniref:Protein Wnt n=1 Tax=Strongyloides venezuelensis TaxID=75913 RepID=A0A0K0FDY6_STRVS